MSSDSISSIAADIVSSDGAALSSTLFGRFRRGDFIRGVAAESGGKLPPFCNFDGMEVDVEILNFGPCLLDLLVVGGVGGVDRPADPVCPGRGDSASAREEDIAEAFNAGAEAIALGPRVRLPTEVILAVSSSARLLLTEAVS